MTPHTQRLVDEQDLKSSQKKAWGAAPKKKKADRTVLVVSGTVDGVSKKTSLK